MPKDDKKSNGKDKKRKIDDEEMESMDESNILSERTRPRNSDQRRRKRYAPPPSDDEDEDNMVIDITHLFQEAFNRMEEDENTKYLKSLPKSKRRRIEKEEKRIQKLNETTIPLRYKIIESNLPERTKAIVMKKIEHYESLPASGSGFFKIKQYMDKLLSIPFGKYNNIGITKEDGQDTIGRYIRNLKYNLDLSIYGQEDAKMRIMEIVAKWISNPTANGNIIGLHGPPGVGKTTLIKKGLSNAINIPFAFVPLGGCTNSATLEGHDYTYEGSKNGKLVDILIEKQCMNPIIFFDELDKVSETKSGEEVTSLLTHLTDFTQNDTISDKYFADINFDFSKCLFIFSYNEEMKINPVLKDRITTVKMGGFSKSEKVEIAKNFTISKICKDIGLSESSFEIPEDVLKYIIDTYCLEEKGIRKLERSIEAILMKINLFIMTGDNTLLKNIDGNTKIVITKDTATDILNRFFNVNDGVNAMIRMMYS